MQPDLADVPRFFHRVEIRLTRVKLGVKKNAQLSAWLVVSKNEQLVTAQLKPVTKMCPINMSAVSSHFA